MHDLARMPFCVATSTTGALSETFIRRHCNELLPGKTVVIAGRSTPPDNHSWDPTGPALYLEPDESKLVRGVKRVLRRAFAPQAERKAITQFLRKHRVEVMLAEWLDLAWPYIPICQELGIRLFARGLGYDTATRLLEPEWVQKYQDFNSTGGIITVHTLGKTRLEKIGLTCPIWVVPCGGEVRTELPQRTESGPPKLIAVGRLTAKKAPHLLLDAFARARQTIPDLTLEMIGRGELEQATRQGVQDRGLADAVTVHGGKPAEFVLESLLRADLFVQHSVVDPVTKDEEGLPVSILEAMGAGLAVVSTRHAGIPDAVVHGETGLLVEERDTEAMAQAIVELIQDRGRRMEMGQRGFERARTRFSWEYERDQLHQIMGLNSL